MDVVHLIQRLAEQNSDVPRVHIQACLNSRFRQRECTLCQDSCPVQAISVYPGDPHLPADPTVLVDDQVCARCGLCLHVCPTGALEQGGHTDWQRDVHTTAAELPGPLELTCPLEEELPRAPVAARLRTQRCLAALSLADLIDLARGREEGLWLDDRLCASCPLHRAHPAIEHTVQQANTLLAAWGTAARVYTYTLHSERLRAPHPVAEHTVGEKAYSRRELFTLFKDYLVRAAASVAEDLIPDVQEGNVRPLDERLQQRVPPHRRHLTAALRRLGSPKEETIDLSDLPWTVVNVSDACSACGLCARFCPTGALRFYLTPPREEEKGHFTLTFVPPDCVDCGVCLLACPEDAISYGHTIYTSWLITREEALLHEGTVVPCEGCGLPTAEEDPPLCYACKAQRRRQARLTADAERKLSTPFSLEDLNRE